MSDDYEERIEELKVENERLRQENDMLFTRAARRLATIKELQAAIIHDWQAVDWEAVDWFVDNMKRKLAANRHKGGWHNDTVSYLFGLLNDHHKMLRSAVLDRKADVIISECTDVANFAMMVADRARQLKKGGE